MRRDLKERETREKKRKFEKIEVKMAANFLKKEIPWEKSFLEFVLLNGIFFNKVLRSMNAEKEATIA